MEVLYVRIETYPPLCVYDNRKNLSNNDISS